MYCTGQYSTEFERYRRKSTALGTLRCPHCFREYEYSIHQSGPYLRIIRDASILPLMCHVHDSSQATYRSAQVHTNATVVHPSPRSSTPNQAIDCFTDPANEKVTDRSIRSGLRRSSTRVTKYLPFNPTQITHLDCFWHSFDLGRHDFPVAPSNCCRINFYPVYNTIASLSDCCLHQNSSLFAREFFSFPSLHPQLSPSPISTPPVMMLATSMLSRSVGHVCRRATHGSVGKGASSLTLLSRPQIRTSSYVA